MTIPSNRSTDSLLGTRLEVLTDAEGDHVAVLVNGRPTQGSLFTSRSMDPQHKAVWLNGERLYDVDLYWNGIYQFTVPADAEVDARSGRRTPAPS